MYGNDVRDDDIPTTFIQQFNDFQDQIDSLESYEGIETIVGLGCHHNLFIIGFQGSETVECLA